MWLYFADLISDIEVTLLLHSAGFEGYAAIAASLLVLQFVAVYFRVLPYLRSTLGRASCVYQLFLYLGFPFGMLLLDVLMFLEPFGLLPVVPMPERMRQFIPAYKATRIIAEVMLESLPQCLLQVRGGRATCCSPPAVCALLSPPTPRYSSNRYQSYILITVMHHVSDHHESVQEVKLLGATLGGTSFSEVLPRSITISVITMLKTWIELVYSAREVRSMHAISPSLSSPSLTSTHLTSTPPHITSRRASRSAPRWRTSGTSGTACHSMRSKRARSRDGSARISSRTARCEACLVSSPALY